MEYARKLKITENEKYTLQDVKYGEATFKKQKQSIKTMAREIIPNAYTLMFNTKRVFVNYTLVGF